MTTPVIDEAFFKRVGIQTIGRSSYERPIEIAFDTLKGIILIQLIGQSDQIKLKAIKILASFNDKKSQLERINQLDSIQHLQALRETNQQLLSIMPRNF